ncbi:MAG: protein translocase subunit SecD, partial [Candidatus Zixiibacteriota bacterium]
AEPVIQKQGNDRIIVDLPGYTDPERAEEIIGQTAQLEFKLLENWDNAQLLLARIDTAVAEYEKAKANPNTQSDTTTKAETPKPKKTESSDTSNIMAEMMGDSAAADTLDFGFDEEFSVSEETTPFSSRLEPFLYAGRNNTQWPGFVVSQKDRPKIQKWLSLPQVKRLIPVDVEFAWSTRPEISNQRKIYRLYLLKRKVQFLGKFLENIRLGRDNMGKLSVSFTLSGEGLSRFAQLTGSNIGKPMAIVIDGKVESAPVIQSKIRKNGQITMGGGATYEDARNLEIVLKAGALPAPVEIIEKNVVGATLGTDSIRKGFYSSLLGLALVLLYIALYYRLSGIIADIGLLFNIFFLLAVMAGLGATLTMPGIAGIILTIGISVDANVLIFERIREELRTGKTVRASIEAGYQRAFVAIFDSHVTTLITAGALFLFGSGPIRGFAVTLFWGVFISLYTAYIITKAIFDIRKQYQKLSI